MAGTTPRPVRIARKPGPDRPAPATGAPPESCPDFRANSLGTQRGIRLFALFGILAVGIYLLFTGLVASSSSSGLRGDPAVYGSLTLLVVVLLVIGFLLTLARAPKAVAWRAEALVVRERLGRVRRFARAGLTTAVVYRYPAGWLATGPTELVTVADAQGHHRYYLVGHGALELDGPPSA